MNVLLTCAGRRTYLVRFFQDALKGRGKVLAVDADPRAPALRSADEAFIVPRLGDAGYVDALVAICRQHAVGLLIPLHDLELPILASHAQCFVEIGVVPLVSSRDVIDTCFDKWASLQFLQRHRLPTPSTCLTLDEARAGIRHGHFHYPVVIKPRWGTASLGVEYPQDDQELALTYDLLKRRLSRSALREVTERDQEHGILIQEYLAGQEYGLDVVNDLDGRYVTTFVRRKLQMRSGETTHAVTVVNDSLEGLGAILGERLCHIGNLDCDVIVDNGQPYLLDMNPRFGGGYPFSHLAGANLPAALLRWATGDTADPGSLRARPGVAAAKCHQLMILNTDAFDAGPTMDDVGTDLSSARSARRRK